MKLGQILLRNQAIQPENLAIALWVQKKWGGTLGRILLSRGYVTEKELLSALSYQLNIPAICLKHKKIPETLTNIIPANLCEQYLIFPFAKEPETGSLLIAMADPLDENALAIISKFVKTRYRLYIAGFIDLTTCMWHNFKTTSATGSFFLNQIPEFEQKFSDNNPAGVPGIRQAEEISDEDIVMELPVGWMNEAKPQEETDSTDYELVEEEIIDPEKNMIVEIIDPEDESLIMEESDSDTDENEENLPDEAEMVCSSDFEIIEEKPEINAPIDPSPDSSIKNKDNKNESEDNNNNTKSLLPEKPENKK